MILMSTIGMSVSKHFCGEYLMQKSVIIQVEACCDSEQMPEGCCHDELDNFSIEDDYQVTKIAYNQELIPINSYIFTNLLQLSSLQDDAVFNSALIESPPLIISEDIYVQIQSFLI
jgi:hypothetical protein